MQRGLCHTQSHALSVLCRLKKEEAEALARILKTNICQIVELDLAT